MSTPTGDEPVIAGPYSTFEGSFILEFLKPDPKHNASVLMKGRYPHSHLLNQKQKNSPQTPPYHIHFNQSESFKVLQGRIGTTTGWDRTDKTWTPKDTGADGVEIVPWRPHTFWSTAVKGEGTDEETVLLVWAHPDGAQDEMDSAFFRNLVLYGSDIHEGKASMDMLQLLLLQHKSSSTIVMFPTAWWLGPLRWWIPWVFQAAAAKVAETLGYKPLREQYTDPGDWKRFLAGQRRKVD